MGVTSHLLCDASRSVAMAYGAAESVDQERATRLSVLVGPDRKILKVYTDPDAMTHPGEVLENLS